MHARRLFASALTFALAAGAKAPSADALIIARVTRHGYILVDEPDAAAPYDGQVGADSSANFANFISDATQTLDAAGAPHADFVAALQGTFFQGNALAFYAPVSNTTRGIGIQIFDQNPTYGTAWPLEGALFLNSPGIYTGGFGDYGTTVICPQEFGHRFITQIHVPGYSSLPQTADAGFDDAGNPLPPPDAGVQASDILLGRDRAHWSYFLNTGGSPVEGNPWEEVTPGVFRTMPSTIAFSPLDLYLLGLIPESMVPPFWLIANPDVLGQTDQGGGLLGRASAPEGFGFRTRTVEVRGQRLTYPIEDVIRVNGPRVPAYTESVDAGPDGEVPDAGGGVNVREMRVIWLLLTTTGAIDSQTASRFDRAIEACSSGYEQAAHGLAHLTAVVMPPPPDAGNDAGADAAVSSDTGTVTPSDSAVASDAFQPPAVRASGGCGCAVPAPRETVGSIRASVMLALAALSLRARGRRAARRRKRGAPRGFEEAGRTRL